MSKMSIFAILTIILIIFVFYLKWSGGNKKFEFTYSDDEELDKLFKDFNVAGVEPTSELFLKTFNGFIEYAENGNIDCAGVIAEVYSYVKPHEDLEKAYCWYHIYYAGQDGYIMDFDNQNGSNEIYYGKVGDFRNESMVSELVDKLGIPKIQELDEKAKDFLSTIRTHNKANSADVKSRSAN